MRDSIGRELATFFVPVEVMTVMRRIITFTVQPRYVHSPQSWHIPLHRRFWRSRRVVHFRIRHLARWPLLVLRPVHVLCSKLSRRLTEALMSFVVMSLASLQMQYAPPAPLCEDTAYVSLLSIHNSTAHSTALATETAKEIAGQRLRGGSDGMGKMMRRQLQLVLVLVRSLRRVESGHCRRPFLLIGALPPIKSVWRSRFEREGVPSSCRRQQHSCWETPRLIN